MMETPEIVTGLRDLVKDRESFICADEPDSVFVHDKDVLNAAADALEKLNDFEHSQLAIVMAENAQLRAVITQNDPDFFKRKCRVCGCDWNHPCEGGCYWVSDDLCSKCVGKEVKS